MRMRIPLLAAVAAALCAAGVTATDGAAAASSGPAVSNLGLETTSVRHDTATSSNWAGYVVSGLPESTSPTSFSRVSARWVQPAASCTSLRNTYPAFWVGLGGSAESSQALEQIGTEADCNANGKAKDAMWYELLPAASVPIKLKVFPGNVIAASVKVNGTTVTLQIRNLTRKTTFTKARRMSAPDLSSAEWVAEAPSSCNAAGRCVELPLSNFGSLSFTRASTTANGHTGTINDPAWTATMIQLVLDTGTPFVDSSGQTAPGGALPSELSTDGTSFGVDWQAATS